jgi:hypothetical protein
LRAALPPLPPAAAFARAGLAVAAVAAVVLLMPGVPALLEPFRGDLRRAAAAGVATALLLLG